MLSLLHMIDLFVLYSVSAPEGAYWCQQGEYDYIHTGNIISRFNPIQRPDPEQSLLGAILFDESIAWFKYTNLEFLTRRDRYMDAPEWWVSWRYAGVKP